MGAFIGVGFLIFLAALQIAPEITGNIFLVVVLLVVGYYVAEAIHSRHERNKRLASMVPPPRMPDPPPPPHPQRLTTETAAPIIFNEIEPLVPHEPWRSLFSAVVTQLVAGEKIWDHSLEDHKRAIVSALTNLAKDLPSIISSPLAAPLCGFLKDPEAIQHVVWTIVHHKYQKDTRVDLALVNPGARDNFMEQCLATPYRAVIGRVWKGDMKKWKYTWDGTTFDDLQYEYLPVEGDHKETYLDGTPFEHILRYPVPLKYTPEKRFEHTQIVGPSGLGKSTLVSHLLLFDLKQPDPPSIIYIDPKRTLIEKLSHLALFDNQLKDRLIIIRPEYHPALNIFDTSQGTAGIIDAVVYLCSMLATELTDKMKGLYRNIANLLLVFPETVGRNATLLDLYDLMVPKFPEKYAPAIKGLRDLQQRFFTDGDFESREYRDTKEQIRTRLNSLFGSADLDSLYTSQRTAINIGAELQKGSIILVECGEGKLDSADDVAVFGCIFIAEVMRAIMQRNAIPVDKRRPAFMYVDEAATFFKGDMSYFFTAARQCKVGGIFAFHTLAQANTDTLRSMLMTNTSTKIISKYAVDDAPTFARHIGMTPDELKALPDWHWACSIRQVVDRAVAITCEPDELDKEPRMSDSAYDQLIERNRQRVSGGQREQPRHEQPRYDARQEQPRQQEEPPEQPPPKWLQADDLALADAYAQLAVAVRRGDTKRAAELQEHIDDLLDRKEASDDYYDSDEQSQSVGIYEPPTSQPRRKRKRPKKRHGPLVGDIDTSA